MKIMFILFLLALTISSIFTEEEYDNFIITIEKATGDIYEHLNLQKIKLSIVPPFHIDPTKLYSLSLRRGFKEYNTPLYCLNAEHHHFSLLVTCDIDLSQVPLGTYLISTFNYRDKTYISTASIKIKEMDDKRISNIQLTNVEQKIKEYQSSANIILEFSDIVEPTKVVSLKFEDKNKNEYKIKLKSCYVMDKKQIKCSIDMNYKGGVYKIINVQYDKEIINPSKDLDLIILEDVLDIEEAYNYHAREICAGKLNTMKINFNNFMKGIYLSKIFLRNAITNIIHEPLFDFIYNPENGSKGVELVLDLHGIPPGKYYIDFVYKLRMTKTNYILDIQHCQPFDYSKIYEN